MGILQQLRGKETEFEKQGNWDMRSFEGKKGKGKLMQLYYNHQKGF